MSINLTDEQVKRVDKIISGIAYRKKSIAPREYTIDDLKSELWLVALKCIEEMGSVEENLIAVKCYSKIIDLIRESKRKSLFTIDSLVMERMGDTEDDACDYGSDFIENDAKNALEDMMIRDMLSQFKKDSNEYKFLEFMIKYYTNINIGERYEGPAKISAVDGYISDLLGFASSSSGGYRRVRNKVRTMVRLYQLGADLNMIYRLEDLGFRCYDECLGWKKEKLSKEVTVELEVYPNKDGTKKYILTVNHKGAGEFDTISELEFIIDSLRKLVNE